MSIDNYPQPNGVLTSLIWRKTMSGGETSLSGYDNASQALSYTPGQEQVYLNGILLVRESDYTATNGTSITALAALAESDSIQINCYNNFSVASVPATSITGLGSGVTTFLVTPSSTNLISAVTDETGSGSLVFSESPEFTGIVSVESSIVFEGTTNATTLILDEPSATRTITLQDASGTLAFIDDITSIIASTDDLPEGENNLYYSDGNVNGVLNAGTGLDKNIVDEIIVFSIDSTVATLADSQTLTNKKLSDSTTSIVDVSDATKVLKFDIAGTTGVIGTISTAFTTDKTITLPDTAGTVALTSGVINNTLTTTTGDTIYASSANTPARLAIGTAAQVLTVNGGATAPEWATAAAGGMTVIASGPIANSTTGFSIPDIPATYNNLQLVIRNMYSSAGINARIRVNNNSGSIYSVLQVVGITTTASWYQSGLTTYVTVDNYNSSSAASTSIYVIDFWDYAGNAWKNGTAQAYHQDRTQGTYETINTTFGIQLTDAINRIDMITGSGSTFAAAGTYTLYGVK